MWPFTIVPRIMYLRPRRQPLDPFAERALPLRHLLPQRVGVVTSRSWVLGIPLPEGVAHPHVVPAVRRALPDCEVERTGAAGGFIGRGEEGGARLSIKGPMLGGHDAQRGLEQGREEGKDRERDELKSVEGDFIVQVGLPIGRGQVTGEGRAEGTREAATAAASQAGEKSQKNRT